ncbi:MAG: hypothetical protein K9N07_08225 [Candidatus Cloacimonetes bacterium]|nr:hypothetical protein [Candidatus Cloacimonadota bacterium]
MVNNAEPTLTLAELYENQDQYIDALVIYKNLNQKKSSEKLQAKINEMIEIIFKENKLEYSKLINELFSDEEKRNFLILPHEQFRKYQESNTEFINEETYPEELTQDDLEELEPEEETSLEIEEESKEIMSEQEDTKKAPVDFEKTEDEVSQVQESSEASHEPKESESKGVVKKQEADSEPDIDESDLLVPDVKRPVDPEIDETTLDDDLSLDSEEDLEATDSLTIEDEEIPQPESETSIEDILKKNNHKQDRIKEKSIEAEEEEDSVEHYEGLTPIMEVPEMKDKLVKLLTQLSNFKPEEVEKVLKENVGSDTPFVNISLSDLNYAIELLKVSENVEEEDNN